MRSNPRFSVIVPVYNRPTEVRDLVESLVAQTSHDFELVIVEDGSTDPCKAEVDYGKSRGLQASYFYKENEGRSIARNYGLERARGDYFIFFDSDCVIPPDYFSTLARELDARPLDCFGGPDAAHDSFTDVQKAINYSMTSFLTTGGIRGGKIQLEKFVPRTFNMGYSRRVYDSVGGFREMFSEDIDMSTRIRKAGFSIGLIRSAYVWHKRRLGWKKFFRQVYVFGMSRVTLRILYPDSLKAVHLLPAVFVVGTLALLLLGIFVSPLWLLPLAAYFLAVFVGALVATGSLRIAFLAVPAALIQLGGYGIGFLKAWVLKIMLGRGRDEAEEIDIRKGKNE
ncbi:MAG: glycosyltransferase [Muribaculaceae bacterium]|nr:glycosyltransferase [Muribaculaceae bacterium]